MHKLAITALAAAMGLAWSTMPAVAADSDKTLKDKAVDAKDTVKEKTSEAWDKTKEKTSEAWDKTKEKTSEAWDKTKKKTRNAKDKVAGQMESSNDIRQAQTALKDKGHDPGPIDGVHGPRTSAALRSYQKAENIKVTGRLDGETRTHLMGQASATSTVTPAASPSTVNQPVPPPASVGSPSNPPMPAEKAQTK